VDPQKRKMTPDFYGYIPDDGTRAIIFGCMLLNSALMLLLRSFSASMLMLAKKRYFIAYLAGDLALYLLLKVVRGDFHYWFPVEGMTGLFISLLLRGIVKMITDFTGVIHFRGPQELGGMYWTLNMVSALLASFLCVWIGGGGAVEWTIVGSLGGAWAFTFGLFFLLMKKQYLHTFFTMQLGKQQVMDYFLKGADDSGKKSILETNSAQWWSIREDVKEWVQANWWRWKREKPKWFDLVWQSNVPKDWITDAEERSRLEVVRKVRTEGWRRSSHSVLMEGMVNSLKVSNKIKPVA